MALVDYERAWGQLAALISGKPHHGARDLALEMARLVAVNSVEESLPERALRLYGWQLHEDLRAAARQESVAEANQDTPVLGGDGSSFPVVPVGPDHRSMTNGGLGGFTNGSTPVGPRSG